MVFWAYPFFKVLSTNYRGGGFLIPGVRSISYTCSSSVCFKLFLCFDVNLLNSLKHSSRNKKVILLIHESKMAQPVSVCVEAPLEYQVQEITYDGLELFSQ